MIKLSELKDDEMLLINNETVLTKKEFLEQFKSKEERDKCKVQTTKIYHTVSFNAKNILDKFIDEESKSMHKEWKDYIKSNITEDEINEVQAVFDKISERNKEYNVSYLGGEEVQIDFEEEKKDE
jgi:hypothetical protein